MRRSYATLSLTALYRSGGLLVALVVKYTDNLVLCCICMSAASRSHRPQVKGYATSVSILLSGGVSFFLFGSNLSLPFLCGAATVMISVLNYVDPGDTPPGPPISPAASGTPASSV